MYNRSKCQNFRSRVEVEKRVRKLQFSKLFIFGNEIMYENTIFFTGIVKIQKNFFLLLKMAIQYVGHIVPTRIGHKVPNRTK